MRVRPVTRLAIFARSLVIQGSWNYRTLIGGGFAFALLPLLRAIHRAEPERLREAVERHAVLFNSHPYLASIALGAVAVLEESREDPRLIERFKAALRGSLGTLGDQLVWAGWRPVCVLLALALLMDGAAWWVGVPSSSSTTPGTWRSASGGTGWGGGRGSMSVSGCVARR